jgi:hypothetical protein
VRVTEVLADAEFGGNRMSRGMLYDHARCRLRQGEQIAVWHSRPHRPQTLAHRMIFLIAAPHMPRHMIMVGAAS